VNDFSFNSLVYQTLQEHWISLWKFNLLCVNLLELKVNDGVYMLS